jgi:hypothetical protein
MGPPGPRILTYMGPPGPGILTYMGPPGPGSSLNGSTLGLGPQTTPRPHPGPLPDHSGIIPRPYADHPQTTPRPLPDHSQTIPRPLPDHSQTTPIRFPIMLSTPMISPTITSIEARRLNACLPLVQQCFAYHVYASFAADKFCGG